MSCSPARRKRLEQMERVAEKERLRQQHARDFSNGRPGSASMLAPSSDQLLDDLRYFQGRRDAHAWPAMHRYPAIDEATGDETTIVDCSAESRYIQVVAGLAEYNRATGRRVRMLTGQEFDDRLILIHLAGARFPEIDVTDLTP